jgi:DNA-binding IclR family transcriptional regulator
MKLSSTARLVLLTLRDTNRSLTISELATLLDKQPTSMLQLLSKMVKAGFLSRHHVGRVSHYTLPTPNPDEATTPAPISLTPASA